MTHYSKEDKRRKLTLQCRYYTGEIEPPEFNSYDESIIWHRERLWMHLSLDKTCVIEAHEKEAKRLGVTIEEGDSTPPSLKMLLYDAYWEWKGYYANEEAYRHFVEWYNRHYLTRQTNRERRAEQRRPTLIARCRYYKGEAHNPWEYAGCSCVNNWRRTYWNLERNWVEGMSMSYSSFRPVQGEIPKLKYWHCEDYFAKQDVPKTLICYILGYHNHVAENSMMELDRESAIGCYEEMYLKYVPLGNTLERFFSFYLGEKENPYSPQEERDRHNRNGLFWMWEEMIYRHLKGVDKLQWLMDDTQSFSKESDDGFFKDANIPLEMKALATYMVMMAGKWLPYDHSDNILNQYQNGLLK